ncbi:hypothetical protein K504DRAFT_54464 [Pleomassaria siparia CBS 279.74]|uniref:LCCL domain-containing protein n=1 Tax=Pleomassaria siparia CBS 279.74 TaxID=1314801 RepID=A0A6G1K370_9PLEO|nr:hypothetical protein K504DRAFT_54464 [Pleomassaria siparia CBS 279.74]
MPPNEYVDRDRNHDNTTHGTEPEAEGEPEAGADEEAQLLPAEELDFEDSDAATKPYITQRRSCWQHLQGPHPLRPQAISPFCPKIQHAPIDLLDRILPHQSHKIVVLAIVIFIWGAIFLGLLSAQLPLQDNTGRNVVNLDCVDTLWRPRNDCGIDGIACRPFSNTSLAFRCPANCASVQLLNPHAVGPLDVNYRPFIIGDEIYRGDSFICASAIHAGVIGDGNGGCGRLSRLGDHENYLSTKKHGIESIPYDSYFPLSFSVESTDSDFTCSTDPRFSLLVVSLLFTTIISIFFAFPWQFLPIFIMIFTQVSFASDPPSASYHNTTVIPDHISAFAKRLLPALFCATIFYFTVVKRTLNGLTAQIEKTLLWLGGFWFGSLANYTFDWIPLSRLTAHDLEQQPGAKVALAVILILLVCIIVQQIVYFWLEGRLLRYLGLYGLFVFCILVFLAIPDVSLRIHHYIIALLLLPGTSMQTRPSLLYQGILLGLFVNGIARWDFDSILQTTAALRADGAFDSKLPTILKPIIKLSATELAATFQWGIPPKSIDGISVLVNDVERDRAFFADEEGDVVKEFTWTRPVGLELNEYFRFAFVRDGRTLDYTRAGTLFANGTWAKMEGQ